MSHYCFCGDTIPQSKLQDGFLSGMILFPGTGLLSSYYTLSSVTKDIFSQEMLSISNSNTIEVLFLVMLGNELTKYTRFGLLIPTQLLVN